MEKTATLHPCVAGLGDGEGERREQRSWSASGKWLPCAGPRDTGGPGSIALLVGERLAPGNGRFRSQAQPQETKCRLRRGVRPVRSRGQPEVSRVRAASAPTSRQCASGSTPAKHATVRCARCVRLGGESPSRLIACGRGLGDRLGSRRSTGCSARISSRMRAS